jgi:hypothetical protein
VTDTFVPMVAVGVSVAVAVGVSVEAGVAVAGEEELESPLELEQLVTINDAAARTIPIHLPNFIGPPPAECRSVSWGAASRR